MDEENEALAEQVNRLFDQCFKKCTVVIKDTEKIPQNYREVYSLELYQQVCETKEQAKIQNTSNNKPDINDITKDLF